MWIERFSRHLKVIQAIVPLAFVGSEVLVLLLKAYYGRFSPIVANETTGHIYPIQLHGAVIYVTPIQHYTIMAMHVCSGLILLSGLLLINRIRNLQKSA